MLGSMLVALVLEGVLPGLTRIRRPVPVVRYDRVREPRSRTNLRDIARRLLGSDTPPAVVTVADWRAADTRSASAATGGCAVFFTGT
jgi:hypothetical protein